MKTNLIFLLILSTISIIGCSVEPNDLNNGLNTNSDQYVLKSYGDSKFDVLGSGFDPSKGYLNSEGERLRVIDVDAFNRERPGELLIQTLNYCNSNTVAGSNAEDISYKLNTKFNGTATIKLLTIGASSDVTSSGKISSKYSYASFYYQKKNKHFKFLTPQTVLNNYLSDNFKKALETMSYSDIIKYYGTHVYTDITTGGILEASYRSIIIGSDKAVAVKMGVEAGIKNIFGVSGSTQIDYSLAQKNTSVSMRFEGRGGSIKFEGVITPETQDLSSGFNSFLGSVNDQNSVLIDAGESSFTPIYEFVSDPTIKAGLKSAVDQYLSSVNYTMAPSNNILCNYNLNNKGDIILPLDYNGDNHDDIMIYRPGSSLVFLNEGLGDGTFNATITSSNGIAGYRFSSTQDRAVAFDYNGDGYDDLLCYHPGHKIVQLLKSTGDGNFSAVYVSTNGIAGYLFSSPDDKAIAIDLNRDGYDDLLCYHPGHGIIQLLKSNGDGTFTPMYKSTNGLAGYKFSSTEDRAVALDYNGDGYDDLFCYHPGKGIVQLLKSDGKYNFTPSFVSTSGVASYRFSSSEDKAISLDYNGDGYDDVICYHPGKGIAYVLKSNGKGDFLATYINNSTGIAGYDLSSSNDYILSLNLNSDCYSDLLLYRAGSNIASTYHSDGTINFAIDYSQK